MANDVQKEARKWLTPYKRNQKAAEQEWRCLACKNLLPACFHIDHKIPLHLPNSTNDWSNLCALCPGCHAEKSAKEMELYWDRRREEKLLVSKYFQPHSKYHLAHPDPATEPPCVVKRRLLREQQLREQQQRVLIDEPL